MENKNQLWELIGQISAQIEEIIQQGSDNSDEIKDMSKKLKKLIELHQKFYEKEKMMRCKQLALMKERNLYLSKCMKIEKLGIAQNWQDKHGLLKGILQIISGESEIEDYSGDWISM